MHPARILRGADGRYTDSASAYDDAARLWSTIGNRAQESRALVCVAVAAASAVARTVERVRDWVSRGGRGPWPDLEG